MGPTITAVTIYLSLLSYLLATVHWVSKHRGVRYRWLWTAGCLFLWAHMVAAFHFYHDWSHAAAVADTAEQTEQLLGVRFGAGIWFNYLLMTLWTIDVWLEWRCIIERSSGSRAFTWLVHGFAFFIIFNGTVVFKEGWVRWAGVVGTLWLLRMAWRFRGMPAHYGVLPESTHE